MPFHWLNLETLRAQTFESHRHSQPSHPCRAHLQPLGKTRQEKHLKCGIRCGKKVIGSVYGGPKPPLGHGAHLGQCSSLLLYSRSSEPGGDQERNWRGNQGHRWLAGVCRSDYTSASGSRVRRWHLGKFGRAPVIGTLPGVFLTVSMDICCHYISSVDDFNPWERWNSIWIQASVPNVGMWCPSQIERTLEYQQPEVN